MWYDEVKDYNYVRPGFSMGTGHFTQVVWKSSTEVGFGVARASNGSYYAVGNYYPPGNMYGQFPQNVLKLGTTTVDSEEDDATKNKTSNDDENKNK